MVAHGVALTCSYFSAFFCVDVKVLCTLIVDHTYSSQSDRDQMLTEARPTSDRHVEGKFDYRLLTG